MTSIGERLSFGPVPSRRLGRSLGINNIPPKICSYTCAYCQLGRTLEMRTERGRFHGVEMIVEDVRRRLEEAGGRVDFLAFVPDGEPTLDLDLGREIEALGEFGIPVAVITNSSLIWDEEVRGDLLRADWVSLKVDSVSERTWRRIDRPHRSLDLASILDGILLFSDDYHGNLNTETMLVGGVNDSSQELERTADFIGEVSPGTAYLSVPTRPPSEEWVSAPDEGELNRAFQIFDRRGLKTELITGSEGIDFSFTGIAREDILSITSVHPMREDAMAEFLSKAGEDWKLVEDLIIENRLVRSEFNGERFYIRRLIMGQR